MKFSARLGLGLIFLAAFAIRLYRLGASSLWYDETVSLYLARLDLASLTRHTAGDIHPPFYYVLLHFWGQFAGWSEFSSAFLSVFLGVLLIALSYRAADEWCNRGVALISAFLVAISPYNLWYSQEVRMYTVGAFLGLASAYFWVRWFQVSSTKRRWRDFIAYVVTSALGMYTLYYFAFLLVFENLIALVWLFRDSRLQVAGRQSKIFLWISSQLAIVMLFLPWLPIAYRQATDPPVPPWRSFVSLPNVLLESFSALALGQSVEWQSPSWVWLALILVAIIIVVGLGSRVANNRSQAKGGQSIRPLAMDYPGIFLLGYTLVPLLVIYLLSLWKPLYHVRYIFVYSPAFYILLALGISKISNLQFTIKNDFARLSARAAYVAIGGFLLLASAVSAYNFWFDPQYTDDDLRGAVKRISENWRPGDAVLINAGYAYTAFVYYFDQPILWRGRLTNYPPTNVSLGTVQRIVDQRAGAVVLQTGSIDGGPSLGWGSAESDFYATSAEETRAALDRVFATHLRVWMLRLYDTVVDPDGIIRDYFAQHARLIDDQVFTGLSNTRAQGYLTSREPLTQLPPNVAHREILLGNRILFLGFEPKEISVRAGEPIDVNLYWRAKEATNADMRVYIGLFREDGQLAAATVERPLGNGLGTSRWGSDEIMREPARLFAPKNLPRGNYVLRIQMYNPFTNEPSAAEPSEWVEEDSQIKLSTVQIQ